MVARTLGPGPVLRSEAPVSSGGRSVPERDPDRNPVGVLLRAALFSATRHRMQRRKDAEASPYINHPLALADLLANEAGISDPVVLAAAILHDTLEDTDTTPAELEDAFGAEIAAVVAEVSDDKSLAPAERKRLQVEQVANKSRRARLVKLADKTCNLRDLVSAPPAAWSLGRKQEYFDWAKQVVDGLRGVHGTLERLFDEAYAKRPR